MKVREFTHIIEKIVRSKTPCYFISPHFDDAIFSAGDLMQSLSGKVPITVINVFTKGGSGPYSISQKVYLKKCGFKEAGELFKARDSEDRKVLKKIGVKRVNLGFTDSLFRQKTPSKIDKFSRLLPELKIIYPTYRFHVIKGLVSDHDRALIKEVATMLKGLIPNDKNNIVFCPLGLGGHVDHIIVKDVCKGTFKNLVFWEDFPYSLGETKNGFLKGKNLKTFSFVKNPIKKSALVLGYGTQVNSFLNGAKKLPKERYYLGGSLNIEG